MKLAIYNRYVQPQLEVVTATPEDITLGCAQAYALLGLILMQLAASDPQRATDLALEAEEVFHILGATVESLKTAAKNINIELVWAK